MAGIFSRMGTLLKANINDLISRAEDPEKILNQLILDMRDQLSKAKKQVAVTIADEKRLKKQLDNELHMVREWEKKAMLAVRAGKDSLAMEALSRKSEHENIAAEYQKQWEMQKSVADKLRKTLRALNKKIEEAKRKKNLLIARQKRAKAQKTIHKTLSGLNDNSAFSAFDRMSEKIDKQEAEAEAYAELSSDNSSLESQFDDLEEDHGSSDALALLKAKMGMGGSSSSSSTSEVSASRGRSSSRSSTGRWDREDF